MGLPTSRLSHLPWRPGRAADPPIPSAVNHPRHLPPPAYRPVQRDLARRRFVPCFCGGAVVAPPLLPRAGGGPVQRYKKYFYLKHFKTFSSRHDTCKEPFHYMLAGGEFDMWTNCELPLRNRLWALACGSCSEQVLIFAEIYCVSHGGARCVFTRAAGGSRVGRRGQCGRRRRRRQLGCAHLGRLSAVRLCHAQLRRAARAPSGAAPPGRPPAVGRCACGGGASARHDP